VLVAYLHSPVEILKSQLDTKCYMSNDYEADFQVQLENLQKFSTASMIRNEIYKMTIDITSLNRQLFFKICV